MNSSEVCDGFFTESMLRLSLPSKIMKAYDDAVCKETLKIAQIDDIVTCRACQFQVELPESAGILLICPKCKVETCRLCGDEGHVPLKCSEVEKKCIVRYKSHNIII